MRRKTLQLAPLQPFNILVICTGNICRSPVAEVMLKEKLSSISNLVVRSAGLAAPNGRAPDRFAREAAEELGYSWPSGKRSRQLVTPDIESATLILVMESVHKQDVRRRSTDAGNRTFLLGQWTIGEIVDPIGRDYAFFQVVVKQIESAAQSWAARAHLLSR